MHLSSVLADVRGEEGASYGDRIVEYLLGGRQVSLTVLRLKLALLDIDMQDLNQESFCSVRAERSVTADISPLPRDRQQFVGAFHEEANLRHT